jgi:signal transduction histidine kinase
MVQALLDLERLPLRDFATSAAVIDLGNLANARIEFLRASTDRPLTVDAARGLHVRADAALIEHVIDNLVGNALKYAPESAVTVRVQQSAGDVILEVEDAGPGIATADRERIFNRFFRGTTAAGTEGLGLGLSLVAEVARWHGGAVSIDAAPRGGSIFRFALPSAAAVARAGGM